MLKVKSFKFSQENEINEFMHTHILYGKANLIVSSGTGEVLIPYEDGNAPTKEQIIAKIVEDINKENEKLGIIIHGQEVIEFTLNAIEAQIKTHRDAIIPEDVVKANKSFIAKEVYDSNKMHQSEIKRLENVFEQNSKTYHINQAEVTRIVNEVEVYQRRIAIMEGKEVTPLAINNESTETTTESGK